MSSSDFDNVRFPSGKETCAAWLFPAHRPSHTDKSTKSPAIILGHGLGGVKEMGLDRYSARFQAAGYTCLAFDYRYFGGSTGSPRRLVDLNRQTEDWSAALDYMMTVAGVDTERIALFGTSQGGGLVISVADKEKRRVKAVVSQCPLTSGIGSVMQKGPIDSVQLTSLAIADWLYSWVGGVVHVRVAGRPNQLALMNTADSLRGYDDLRSPEVCANNEPWIPARVLLQFPFFAPGSHAKNVTCPIYFAVCETDSVCPPLPSIEYAKKAPRGRCKVYKGIGHFDIYLGKHFEVAVEDYIRFYDEVV